MKEFRIGIMGAGSIAVKFCNAVSQIEGAAVAAVASKSLERAQSFAKKNGVARWYDSYEAMLEQEELDLVYIATTIQAHCELMRLCLERGVPVLCEKSMARSAAEAEEVFRISEEKQIFAMEAMWARFLPKTRKAMEWIREGRIGEVKMGVCTLGSCPPRDAGNLYFNPELGGGTMYDTGVYAIELMQYLMGEPVIEVKTMMEREEMQVDVMDQVLLRFPHGMAALQFTLSAMAREVLIISGSKGRIELPNPHYGKECILYEGREETEHFIGDEENGFVYEIREAMRCVREGRIESPVIPHRDTVGCARIFDQIWGEYEVQ
ncbi:MAG: Gfo/Idh/MocA family oxidoreductase [Eubacteriales bacterium]|nr:Gfo/Idh/MocA family oxidoreductase [Eubacteriales bacterium]